MYLIIGLGNPGKQYQNTRHNLGQAIVSRLGSLSLQPKFNAQTATLGDKLLCVPNTYMNLSGTGIWPLVNFYKIPLENVYVIHDDLDLAVGEYRLQFDRGPAGHKGVESIIESLGSKAFWRLRVGIGHPSQTNTQILVEDYVLQPFSAVEKPLIEEVIGKILTDIQNLGS